MNAPPTPARLLDCAVTAALAAGAHARAHRGRRSEVNASYAHDLKLQLDVECQQVAEASILQCFPNHAILGEEGSAPDASAEFEWVIDPIDGTLNFFHGLPHWCSSVAVRRGDGPILAGCVFLPDLDECFAAAEGLPATLNGEPIRVSATARLSEAMLLTGLGKPAPGEAYDLSLLGRLANTAQKTRVLGAAAVDICYVACGRVDAYVDAGICLWDYAGAEIITRQAGGRAGEIGRLSGGRVRYLASNGVIHDEVLKLYLGPTAP
ncbi:MAG: inositol monophosphatase [Kiritimatiellia bacterium]